MLRSLPTTLLVCIVLSVLTMSVVSAWADDPDKALDVLLKPSKNEGVPASEAGKALPPYTPQSRRSYRPVPRWTARPPFGRPITKVKPPCVSIPCAFTPPCILPRAGCKQWEMSASVTWARVWGTVAWPRYSRINTTYTTEADLTDDLQIPKSQTLVELTASYQFRPHWALRYSVMFDEVNGGGDPQDQFYFGPNTYTITIGYNISTKWEYAYQRVGLVYNAINTCGYSLSVFADWMHTDDKINLNCNTCGNQTYIFSVGGDTAIAGLEIQKCLQTAFNGGTFSLRAKAGVIFLDDTEGWDVKTGLRYSIPLGCGRWGFAEGGYRFFDYKKSPTAYLWHHAMEGGYVEAGFVF
jgi:hypothetical protein